MTPAIRPGLAQSWAGPMVAGGGSGAKLGVGGLWRGRDAHLCRRRSGEGVDLQTSESKSEWDHVLCLHAGDPSAIGNRKC
jgi:hypothetical protein